MPDAFKDKDIITREYEKFVETVGGGVVTLYAENTMEMKQISTSGTTVAAGGWA